MNKNNNSTKILHQQTYIQTSIPMYITMYIVTCNIICVLYVQVPLM